MKLEYIFDVDGTLTPSRGTIDPQFKKEFLAFARTHNVYLVTVVNVYTIALGVMSMRALQI